MRECRRRLNFVQPTLGMDRRAEYRFDELVTAMPEPYATMVHNTIYTGLRVTELVALACAEDMRVAYNRRG